MSEDSEETTLAWSEGMISTSPSSRHHQQQRGCTNTSGGGGGSGEKHPHLALEAFGTANSYGHEIWVEKYLAKMMVRKVFDKTVWVENDNIRIMQDKVALQALIWSIIATVPLTVLFTAMPSGRFF